MHIRTDDLRDGSAGYFSREAIGMGVLRAWTLALYSFQAFPLTAGSLEWDAQAHLLAISILCVCFFALAVFGHFRPVGTSAFRHMSLVVAEVGSIGLYTLETFVTDAPVFLTGACAVAANAGIAMLTVSWGNTCTRLGHARLVPTMLGACLVSATLQASFSTGSLEPLGAIMVFGPLAAHLCLAAGPSAPQPSQDAPAPSGSPVDLRRILALVFLFSIVTDAAGAFAIIHSDSATIPDRKIVNALVLALAATAVVGALGHLNLRNLLITWAAVAAASFLLLSFVHTLPGIENLGRLVHTLGCVVIWTYLVSVYDTAKHNSLTYFGLCLGLHSLGNLVGDAIVRTIFPAARITDAIGMLTFSLIMMALLFAGLLGSIRTLSGGPAEKPADDQPVRRRYDDAVEALANAYGLTERERTLLWHLAKGYSTKSIQDRLLISASTVSAHSSNIYRKLDVHSKEEAAELVRSWEAPAEDDRA